MTNVSKKIFVGLSGGVDSAVSAALLKQEGHNVIGVFIKVWQADFLPCTWREERRDAMRVAATLNIPFLTLDLEKEYKAGVIDYLIQEYSKGRVPNPDVMCNKHVKFGAFLNFAKKHGADYIATGHYARIIRKDDMHHLYAGIDNEKDQSYFLWTLTQSELPHIMFPVGHLLKSKVRELATRLSLPNSIKRDSQGLCFMGNIDMPTFLKHYLHAVPGDVLDEEGKVVGTHDGSILYTIGQRHGFKTEKLCANESPRFVIEKNIAHNTITVSTKPIHDAPIETIHVTNVNDINGSLGIDTTNKFTGRIRHRGKFQPLDWVCDEINPIHARAILKKPISDASDGQSIVIYRNDECLGGGIMERNRKHATGIPDK